MPDTLRLTWPRPAADWVEAAPIGNGRLGAMVFGGDRDSRIQINDATVWSGTPSGPDRALEQRLAAGAGPRALERVRAAIARRDYRAAESELMDFQGPWTQEFLPFVDLVTTLIVPSAAADDDYLGRSLDLDDALASEAFRIGGVGLTRTTFASRPGRVIASTLTASSPVSLRVRLTSPLPVVEQTVGDDGIVLGVALPVDGAPEHEPDAVAHRYSETDIDGYDPFAVAALAVRTDGQITREADALLVTGATRILVTVASSTNSALWWANESADLSSAARPTRLAEASATAAGAADRGSEALLADHLADIRPLLAGTRVRFGTRRTGDIEVARDVLGLGVDGAERDDALIATVMLQYGRYLLASSSRPGGPPANLQGIWNTEIRPPWSSNYTVNINTEMNYWGAEATGLAECHEPLLDLLGHLAVRGRATAEQLYGAKGWVTHHNTDFWGWTLPVGAGHSDPSWALWMMGGTWLSTHLWKHYEHTLDEAFLRNRAWPILTGASAFALSWLLDDGPDRPLRTSPSTSPENKFLGPDGGEESLAESSPMDFALIRAVFEQTLLAAEVLGRDDAPLDRIRNALDRLPTSPIRPDGLLQEWGTNHPEADPHHRHMSHLVALYPLGQIDPRTTPELADAATAVLDARGQGAMGWSWAWKIALRARLGHGDAARRLLLEATTPFTRDHTVPAPPDGSEWGGLLPNLFSTHPPVQLDGNYGFVAGLTETLVRSRRGLVELLPALPSAWREGEATGIRAPGGLSIDLAWSAGRLVSASLRRIAGTEPEAVTVAFPGGETSIVLGAGERVTLPLAALADVPA